MRKSTYLIIVFLSISAMLFAKKPWPTTVAGTYKIATFDKVPTAQFDSIAEAVAWLNQAGPVTGDINFEIGSDLVEWTDFGLAKDMSGYKLTIRPDMDADRRIYFPIEAAKVNATFSYGNFFIGYRTGAIKNQSSTSVFAPDSLISTSNVTIDGYAVGGSTPRLKWSTANRPAPQSAVFSVVGSCDNIVIKNCLFDLQNTYTGASYGIYLSQFKSSTYSIDRSPTNIVIDNNQFTALGGNANGAIGFGKVSSPLTQVAGCVISNNKFKVSGFGIMLLSSYNINLDILKNEFNVIQGTSQYGSNSAIRVTTSSNCPGTINIIGNKFLETSTKQLGASTISTIYLSGSGSTISAPDVNIYNNTFAGLNRFGASLSTVNVNVCYILAGTGNEHSKIYNNTFYLPGLAMPNTSGDFMAIKYESATASNWKTNIRNNIFATDDDKKAIFISNINTGGVVNNNAYCFYPSTYKSGITRNITTKTDTIRTLSDLKNITTLYDNNSVETPIAFTNTLTGDLTLDAGLMALEYCLPLSAPKLAEVMTDITGKVRGNPTLIGAHEVLTLPTDISKTKSSVKLIRTVSGIEIRTDNVAKIQIIDMNGIVVDQATIESRYFRSLQNGVYVVRVNGETFKFVK